MSDFVRWQCIGSAAALFCSGAHAAARTEPEGLLVSEADVFAEVPIAVTVIDRFDTRVFGRVSLDLP